MTVDDNGVYMMVTPSSERGLLGYDANRYAELTKKI